MTCAAALGLLWAALARAVAREVAAGLLALGAPAAHAPRKTYRNRSARHRDVPVTRALATSACSPHEAICSGRSGAAKLQASEVQARYLSATLGIGDGERLCLSLGCLWGCG